MFGTVAAGKERGGYDSIVDAAKVMARVKDKVYKPVPENVRMYDKLYAEYKILHDYFGRGASGVYETAERIADR